MKKKVTFQNIADSLGVSKGLVSLAIRNKYGVSEEMRAKIVLKAIELGYVFKKESKDEKKIVTLLVKNMGILNEDFWRRCILGIESECTDRKLVFSILSWMDRGGGDDFSVGSINEKCCGIIVLNQCRSSIIEKIGKLNVPIVFLDMINPVDISSDQVMANNFGAGMQAVNYLLSKGHRDILLFGNIEYSFSFLQRFYGCMKALKHAQKRGLQVQGHTLIDCFKNHLFADVYQDEDSILCNDIALNEFLETKKKFTAVVCFNDSILKRVLSIFMENGIRIPEDVSVISIDNVQCSEDNGVTSVDIPKAELGAQAVRLLVDRLDNKRNNSVNLELNTVIIERNSVKEVDHEKK